MTVFENIDDVRGRPAGRPFTPDSLREHTALLVDRLLTHTETLGKRRLVDDRARNSDERTQLEFRFRKLRFERFDVGAVAPARADLRRVAKPLQHQAEDMLV